MSLINTQNDLEEYIKKIERQKEVLQLSRLFSNLEIQQILEVLDELLRICKVRMSVEDIENLEE